MRYRASAHRCKFIEQLSRRAKSVTLGFSYHNSMYVLGRAKMMQASSTRVNRIIVDERCTANSLAPPFVESSVDDSGRSALVTRYFRKAA